MDGGAFGYAKGAMSTAGAKGAVDWFINGSAQREDGFRDHSRTDAERLNANLGYQLTPDAETRFYVNANTWHAEIPGELDKSTALRTPRAANPVWVQQDRQRNIDSIRLANKTTFRLDDTLVDVRVFTHQRYVDHPIFRYIDYTLADYGGFVRVTDDRVVNGFRNRLVAGLHLQAGTTDYTENVNPGGAVKGALVRSEWQRSQNHSAYLENSFYVLPNVALIAGGQFLHAVRDRQDRFLLDGDQSARRS